MNFSKYYKKSISYCLFHYNNLYLSIINIKLNIYIIISYFNYLDEICTFYIFI